MEGRRKKMADKAMVPGNVEVPKGGVALNRNKRGEGKRVPSPDVVAPRILLELEDYIVVDKELGRGTFGTVFEGRSKVGNEKVAVKRLEITVGADVELVEEIKMLGRIKLAQCPHLISLLGYRDVETYLYLVFALCIASLAEVIDGYKSKSPPTFMDEAMGRKLLWEMCEALAALERANIVHRDIKPENILIKSARSGQIFVLADFSESRILRKRQQAKTFCGTHGFIAPEIALGLRQSYKVDIFSLAMVVELCLFGQLPFEYAENMDYLFWDTARKVNLNIPVPITASPLLRDLLKGMRAVKASDRLSLVKVREHGFFKDENGTSAASGQALKNLAEATLTSVKQTVDNAYLSVPRKQAEKISRRDNNDAGPSGTGNGQPKDDGHSDESSDDERRAQSEDNSDGEDPVEAPKLPSASTKSRTGLCLGCGEAKKGGTVTKHCQTCYVWYGDQLKSGKDENSLVGKKLERFQHADALWNDSQYAANCKADYVAKNGAHSTGKAGKKKKGAKK